MKKTSLAIAIAALLSAGINTSLWAESPTMHDNDQMRGEKMDGEQMHDKSMDENESSQPSTMPSGAVKQDRVTQSTMMQPKSDIQPADYLKKEIITSNGESIGTIEKLVISKKDNTVHAISGVGGFMGIGEKVVAIPVNQLRVQGDSLVLSAEITEDSLKQEKKYEKSEFSAFEVKSNTSNY